MKTSPRRRASKPPKRKPPADSMQEWAETTSGAMGRRNTKTEVLYPHLVDEIRRFLQMRAAGKTRASMQSFHAEWLQAKRGYELGYSTFRNHCQVRHRELYDRCAARR